MPVQSAARTSQQGVPVRTGLLSRLYAWIPVLVLAYPTLIAPFLLNVSGEENPEANIVASKSNAINQLFWLGLFALTLLSAGKRLLGTFSVLRNPVVWMLLAYLALATLSVLWSPVPGIAFRRVVLQIIIVLSLVISVGLTDDARGLLGRLTLLMNAVVLLNCLAVAVLPPTPIGHAGIYSQKNALGAVMALAFMFNLYGLTAARGFWKRAGMVMISMLAFALLILSQSKTSLGLAVLMPAIAFVLVGAARLVRINAALLLLFGGVTGLVTWFFVSAVTRFSFADLSMLLFNDETFTGRTFIWAFAVDVISRSPVLGQGYASFWATGSDSIAFREAPGFVVLLIQAHNGYLDVLLETGAVGLSLLAALILTALFSAARAVPIDRGLAFVCFSLMLFVIAHNMLESSWFRSYGLNWLVFQIAALLPGALLRRTRQTPY